MAFINWNDSLDLGIAEIDREHRDIASRINGLYESIKTPGNGIDRQKLVAEIMAAAETHFKTEERIFEYYGYPDAAAHLELHKTLERQLQDLLRQTDSGAIPFSDPILSFVKDWFLTHTTGSDLIYAVWMKRQGFIQADSRELMPRT